MAAEMAKTEIQPDWKWRGNFHISGLNEGMSADPDLRAATPRGRDNLSAAEVKLYHLWHAANANNQIPLASELIEDGVVGVYQITPAPIVG